MKIETRRFELEVGRWALFVRLGKHEAFLEFERPRWQWYLAADGLHMPGLHIAAN